MSCAQGGIKIRQVRRASYLHPTCARLSITVPHIFGVDALWYSIDNDHLTISILSSMAIWWILSFSIHRASVSYVEMSGLILLRVFIDIG